VDDQEFYQLIDQDGISDDIHLFNEKLREWEDYYNYHRPHGALQGQTPFERLIEKTRAGVTGVVRLYKRQDGALGRTNFELRAGCAGRLECCLEWNASAIKLYRFYDVAFGRLLIGTRGGTRTPIPWLTSR
jgi:hypothetical protein